MSKIFMLFLGLILAPHLGWSAEVTRGTTSAGTSGQQGPQVPSGASNTAGQQKSDSGMGSMLNMAAGGVNTFLSYDYGAAYAASCSVGCESSLLAKSILHGLMAAQNFMQSDSHDSNGANSAMSQADFSNPLGNNPAAATKNDNGSLISDKMNDLAGKLAANGFKLNKNGSITAPNGKTYSGKDIASVEGYVAMGGTSDDYSKAMAAAAALEKKIAEKLGIKIGEGLDEGGGGIGGLAGTETIIEEEYGAGGAEGSGRGGKDGKGDREPTSVAGLSKDFNGDKIGVAADNIFDMIKRRYDLKDKQNSFINDNSAPAPTAALKK